MNILRTVIHAAADVGLGRRVLRKATALYHYAVSRGIEEQVRNLTNSVVQSGPCIGLAYPELPSSSVHTSITPKLLGLYECELYPALERMLSTNTYSRFIDIGAAEGYYVAGIGIRQPSAQLIAFEADQGLASSLQSLCTANGVIDRVIPRGFCKPSDLIDLGSTGRSLVLCDCEGGEIDLITKESIKSLSPCDFIVECHDMYVDDCTSKIQERFSGTHRVSVVTSNERTLSDVPKSTLSKLVGRPDEIEYGIGEHRHYQMNWIIAEQQ